MILYWWSSGFQTFCDRHSEWYWFRKKWHTVKMKPRISKCAGVMFFGIITDNQTLIFNREVRRPFQKSILATRGGVSNKKDIFELLDKMLLSIVLMYLNDRCDRIARSMTVESLVTSILHLRTNEAKSHWQLVKIINHMIVKFLYSF